MIRVRLVLAVLLPLLLLAPASARDLFVDNRFGDDTRSGLAPMPADNDGPLATIEQALRIAAPGDHIRVANTGTPYREQVSIFGCNQHGLEGRPLTLSGNGAVLDGTVAAAYGAWRHVEGDVFAMRPRRLAYQQLFRDGQPLERAALVTHYGVAQALGPLQWSYLDGRLLLRVEEGDLPSYYDLRHAGLQTGITLYNTRHVVIEDFIVQGFQQDGVNAHELVRDCVLRGVECRANGRSGLSVGGVSRVRADRCAFYDNGRVQVRAEGLSRLTLVGCEVAGGQGALRYGLRGGEILSGGRPVAESQ